MFPIKTRGRHANGETIGNYSETLLETFSQFTSAWVIFSHALQPILKAPVIGYAYSFLRASAKRRIKVISEYRTA
jgi:hypothetical protein